MQEKVHHFQKLLDELEQREQLREIELVNEIKILNSKKEEKEELLEHAREEIAEKEQQTLEMEAQIQEIKYSMRNLEAELQLAKTQEVTYRDTSVNFEEKMLALQRTEANSLCSIEELQEDNLNLKLMVKENESAITALGKRYDALLKGTVLTLTHFSSILSESKNIANQTVKHEKP